jgi:uncharacterized protein (DUF58 family)
VSAVALSRRISGLVLTSVAAVAASGVSAVVLQRPYLVELGVPFLIVLVVGLAMDRPASLEAEVTLPDDRLLDGDSADIVVTLRGHTPGGRVVVELLPPPGVTYAEDTPAVRVVRLPDSGSAVVRFRLVTPPWGVHRWQPLTVRALAPLGLVSYFGTVEVEPVLRVLPVAELLEKLARTSRTGIVTGARVAAAKSEGFEFADIRAFVPGDRRRHVNWRATARRGELRVNDHHPERSTDVVLMLDAFPSAGLAPAVGAAVSLAAAYLGERDRVGLVRFGTMLEWLTPAMGARQQYRIVDVLLEASALRNAVWQNVNRLPGQALPPNALVIAVTPLADTFALSSITQVAAQGARLVVVEVAADSLALPGPAELDRLAYAMWRLGLEETRERLRDRGIPVVPWQVGQPLAPVIEEVAAFLRYARHRTG